MLPPSASLIMLTAWIIVVVSRWVFSLPMLSTALACYAMAFTITSAVVRSSRPRFCSLKNSAFSSACRVHCRAPTRHRIVPWRNYYFNNHIDDDKIRMIIAPRSISFQGNKCCWMKISWPMKLALRIFPFIPSFPLPPTTNWHIPSKASNTKLAKLIIVIV